MSTVFDEEEKETKETTEPVFEFDYFVNDLNMLAIYYIDVYFCDKDGKDGKRIPKSILHLEKYISYVLNLDICSGMEKIYQLIGIEYTNEQMRFFERQGQLPDDVKYVILMLHDCSKRGIPKQFAIGIFLMHLELCDRKMAA